MQPEAVVHELIATGVACELWETGGGIEVVDCGKVLVGCAGEWPVIMTEEGSEIGPYSPENVLTRMIA